MLRVRRRHFTACSQARLSRRRLESLVGQAQLKKSGRYQRHAGGATDFCARFLDASDNAVRDLVVRLSPEPQ